MSSSNKYEVAPEEDSSCDGAPCFARTRVDGYHLATLRASRKKSAVTSVNLFRLDNAKSIVVGRVIFHYKSDLPEDSVEDSEDGPVIVLNAQLKDFDRMMDLIRGECHVGLEFSGEDWAKGRAYLKSLCYVFPERTR